jgi:hypothetical protein
LEKLAKPKTLAIDKCFSYLFSKEAYFYAILSHIAKAEAGLKRST